MCALSACAPGGYCWCCCSCYCSLLLLPGSLPVSELVLLLPSSAQLLVLAPYWLLLCVCVNTRAESEQGLPRLNSPAKSASKSQQDRPKNRSLLRKWACLDEIHRHSLQITADNRPRNRSPRRPGTEKPPAGEKQRERGSASTKFTGKVEPKNSLLTVLIVSRSQGYPAGNSGYLLSATSTTTINWVLTPLLPSLRLERKGLTNNNSTNNNNNNNK